MRRFFGIWTLKKQKIRILSEIEIVTLLDLMIELGIMLNKVSSHDLESSTEKFHIIFTYKKWLQLYFFLQTI